MGEKNKLSREFDWNTVNPRTYDEQAKWRLVCTLFDLQCPHDYWPDYEGDYQHLRAHLLKHENSSYVIALLDKIYLWKTRQKKERQEYENSMIRDLDISLKLIENLRRLAEPKYYHHRLVRCSFCKQSFDTRGQKPVEVYGKDVFGQRTTPGYAFYCPNCDTEYMSQGRLKYEEDNRLSDE